MHRASDISNLIRTWLAADGTDSEVVLEEKVFRLQPAQLLAEVAQMHPELSIVDVQHIGGCSLSNQEFIPVAIMCFGWLHDAGWRHWGYRFAHQRVKNSFQDLDLWLTLGRSQRSPPRSLLNILAKNGSFAAWALLGSYRLINKVDLIEPLLVKGLGFTDERYGEVIVDAHRLGMSDEILRNPPRLGTKAFPYYVYAAIGQKWLTDLATLREYLVDDEPVLRAAVLARASRSRPEIFPLEVRVDGSDPLWMRESVERLIADGFEIRTV